MRPFLPPLLAGALARGDLGLDFDGTGYAFLEQPPFLAAVLALAVLAYAVDRVRAGRDERPPRGGGERRDPLVLVVGVLAAGLGALLLAGSLAGEGFAGWPGLLAGAACAALGYVAATMLFGRARRRLDPSAAALLPVWADGVALALAGLAVLLPPIGLVALVAFAWLTFAARRAQGRKFEGLRVLR